MKVDHGLPFVADTNWTSIKPGLIFAEVRAEEKGTLTHRAVAVGEVEETRRERGRSRGIIPSSALMWWRHLTVFV